LRPSLLVRWDENNVVIDAGPDFRQQALEAGIEKLQAILFTHAHADHILGIDDLRPFNFHQRGPIPIHCTAATIEVIQRVFHYIFHAGPSESSRPEIEPVLFDGEAFDVAGLDFLPIPLRHGSGPSHGFRFSNVAYLTDHSEIPEESMDLLWGLDVLFLDALRYKPHPTHSTVEQSLKTVEQLRPRRAYFTHISHDLDHERAESLLPDNVRLAYDGLEIKVEAARP
jgi:phosphoribosyl 1,2-cyclic phosphate phosphodiesterase